MQVARGSGGTASSTTTGTSLALAPNLNLPLVVQHMSGEFQLRRAAVRSIVRQLYVKCLS